MKTFIKYTILATYLPLMFAALATASTVLALSHASALLPG